MTGCGRRPWIDGVHARWGARERVSRSAGRRPTTPACAVVAAWVVTQVTRAPDLDTCQTRLVLALYSESCGSLRVRAHEEGHDAEFSAQRLPACLGCVAGAACRRSGASRVRRGERRRICGGIRYIDLRVEYRGDTFYIVHSLVSTDIVAGRTLLHRGAEKMRQYGFRGVWTAAVRAWEGSSGPLAQWSLMAFTVFISVPTAIVILLGWIPDACLRWKARVVAAPNCV
jgi:hypothetical protein